MSAHGACVILLSRDHAVHVYLLSTSARNDLALHDLKGSPLIDLYQSDSEPPAHACLARHIHSGSVTLVTEAGDLCAR